MKIKKLMCATLAAAMIITTGNGYAKAAETTDNNVVIDTGDEDDFTIDEIPAADTGFNTWGLDESDEKNYGGPIEYQIVPKNGEKADCKFLRSAPDINFSLTSTQKKIFQNKIISNNPSMVEYGYINEYKVEYTKGNTTDAEFYSDNVSGDPFTADLATISNYGDKGKNNIRIRISGTVYARGRDGEKGPEVFTYQTSISAQKSIIIDPDAPKISKVTDKNGTVTVEATDGDSSIASGVYKYYAATEDMDLKRSDPKWTKSNVFQLDDDIYYIYAIDKAGNISSPYVLNKVKSKKMSELTISGIESKYDYTGEEIKPSITVKDGDKVLTEGKDYEVKYANNINVGKATLVITGLSDKYTDRVTKDFAIASTDINNGKVECGNTYTYTGKTIIPSVTVTYNNKTLVKDKDYTITCKAKDAGESTFDINGIGNFMGKVTKK